MIFHNFLLCHVRKLGSIFSKKYLTFLGCQQMSIDNFNCWINRIQSKQIKVIGQINGSRSSKPIEDLHLFMIGWIRLCLIGFNRSQSKSIKSNNRFTFFPTLIEFDYSITSIGFDCCYQWLWSSIGFDWFNCFEFDCLLLLVTKKNVSKTSSNS